MEKKAVYDSELGKFCRELFFYLEIPEDAVFGVYKYGDFFGIEYQYNHISVQPTDEEHKKLQEFFND